MNCINGLCYLGPCMCHMVDHYPQDEIFGCVPSVANSASEREMKWPEHGPKVKHWDVSIVSMSVMTFLNKIKDDVQQSREQRGVEVTQPSDYWVH